MLHCSKKRKIISKKNESLAIIKKVLNSNTFKRLELKSIYNFPEFAEIVLNKHGVVSAKLCENNLIHIKVENVYGFLYEGFTDNYEWFIETFYF